MKNTILLSLPILMLFTSLEAPIKMCNNRVAQATPQQEIIIVPQDFSPTINTVQAIQQTTSQIMLQGNASVSNICPTFVPVRVPLMLGPQTPTLQFTAAHGQETGTYGPSFDGAAGRNQFLLACKARVRSFCKSTGLIDNILNVSFDKFFGIVNDGFLCADPNVLFDHSTNQWYIACDTSVNVFLAISDGLNNGDITAETVWSFFIISNTALGIPQYANNAPAIDSITLGYDENSILLAGRVFDDIDPLFLSGSVYILPKQKIIPLTTQPGFSQATIFSYLNLTNQVTRFGPDTTQALTHFDSSPPAAYFLGINTATNTFPAGASNFLWVDFVPYDNNNLPTILTQFGLLVPPFSGPVPVFTPNSPKLVTWVDAEISRGAHVRENTLIFAQNISVNSFGESGSTVLTTQNAARYYRIDALNFTIFGVGTLFDPAGTSYTTPSLMSNQNNEIVIGATIMGPNHFIDASLVAVPALEGEFVFTPPVRGYTTSKTPYFSTDDWELFPFSRWGDHSRTTLDPVDMLTFWTAQGFCIDSSTWGTQVAKR